MGEEREEWGWLRERRAEMAEQDTRFGFSWGPVKVERFTEHRGSVYLTLSTARQLVDVRVTPSGLIRIGEPRPLQVNLRAKRP